MQQHNTENPFYKWYIALELAILDQLLEWGGYNLCIHTFMFYCYIILPKRNSRFVGYIYNTSYIV